MNQPPKHNYLAKLARLVASGKLAPIPGKVSILDVSHDDDCAIFAGGLCDCDPDITLRPATEPDA